MTTTKIREVVTQPKAQQCPIAIEEKEKGGSRTRVLRLYKLFMTTTVKPDDTRKVFTAIHHTVGAQTGKEGCDQGG